MSGSNAAAALPQGDNNTSVGFRGFSWIFLLLAAAASAYAYRLHTQGRLRGAQATAAQAAQAAAVALALVLNAAAALARAAAGAAAAAAAAAGGLAGGSGSATALGGGGNSSSGSNSNGAGSRRGSGSGANAPRLPDGSKSVAPSGAAAVAVTGSGVELAPLGGGGFGAGGQAAPALVGLAPGETPLLSAADVAELTRQLPSRCVGKVWKLLFSTSQHGYALSTLYSRSRGHGPTVLVVLDDASHVFGAFASRDWSGNDLASSTLQFSLSTLARAGAAAAGAAAAAAAAAAGGVGSSAAAMAGSGVAPETGYFGSGESFLFRSRPESAQYRWTGKNSNFQLARRDLVALGGGGGKFGLCLDAALDRGWSGACETYSNPPLAGEDMFRALRVEVWGFVLPHEASATAGASGGIGGGATGAVFSRGISSFLSSSSRDFSSGPRAWQQVR